MCVVDVGILIFDVLNCKTIKMMMRVVSKKRMATFVRNSRGVITFILGIIRDKSGIGAISIVAFDGRIVPSIFGLDQMLQVVRCLAIDKPIFLIKFVGPAARPLMLISLFTKPTRVFNFVFLVSGLVVLRPLISTLGCRLFFTRFLVTSFLRTRLVLLVGFVHS